MQITLKTLQQQTIQIDIDDDQTVFTINVFMHPRLYVVTACETGYF